MLLLMESFDVFAPGDYAIRGWSAAFTGSGLGRYGIGQSMSIDVPTYKTLLAGSAATVFIQTGFKTSLTSGEITIFQGYQGGNPQFGITYSLGANVFKLYRGTAGTGTLVATSTAASLIAGAWNFIDTKVVLHASAGSFEINFNQVNLATVTGLNTAATATLSIGAVGFGGGGLATWDDFACYDNSGVAPNSALGDQQMGPLVPTGDGAHLDFTPSTGTSHYALVDETTPNATDEVHSSTTGHIDTYVMSDVPTNAVITAVQWNAACYKDGAGSRTLTPVLRSGGVDRLGTAKTPLLSQSYLSQIFTIDPATGLAFTAANLNAMELGAKVTT